MSNRTAKISELQAKIDAGHKMAEIFARKVSALQAMTDEQFDAQTQPTAEVKAATVARMVREVR